MSMPSEDDKRVFAVICGIFGDIFGDDPDPDINCALDEKTVVGKVKEKTGLDEESIQQSITAFVAEGSLVRGGERGEMIMFNDDAG